MARLFTRFAASTFAVLAAATVVSAASPAPAQAATWSPCLDTIDNIDCATYAVPRDRTGGVAGTMNVRAVRVAAPEGPRMGTLFVIAGGPGQSALEMVDLVGSLFGGANRYDIVALDQRGSGASEPLNCPRIEAGQFDLLGDSTRRDWPVTQCADALGTARYGYNTAEAVADLEVVRADLGVDRVSLFGVSYGTKVALAYAGTHPEHTQALLLDSVLPTDLPAAFDVDAMTAARRAIAQLCSAGRCRGITGRPVSDIARLAARLQRSPLPTYAIDPQSGRVLEGEIDADALYAILLEGDVNPFVYNQLPAAVASALRGDTSQLTRLHAILSGVYAEFRSRRVAKRVAARVPRTRRSKPAPRRGQRIGGREAYDITSFSATMNFATNCADLTTPWPRGSDPASRQLAIEAAADSISASAAHPFTRTTLRNNSLAVLCRGWRESAVQPTLPASPPPGIPTLALNGSLDLRTPTEWAQRAVAGNPAGELREIQFGGHSVIGTDVTGCALSLAKRFLIFGATDGKCNRPAQRLPIAPRPNGSVSGVTPLRGSCRGIRGRACRQARQVVTAGYLAVRDTMDQLLIGGQLSGPGLYDGAWEGDFDIADDLMSLDLLGVEMESVSNVLGTAASGSINLEELPAASGKLSVFGGRFDFRVALSGRFAYDRRDDRIVLTARSGRRSVTVRTSARRARAAKLISAAEFGQRLRYARVAGAGRAIR